NRRLWAGLRIIAAAESLAEAAIGARAERYAVGVGIGLRQIARRLWERLIAYLFRRLRPQHGAIGLFLGRRRIRSRTRTFERIAERLNLPLQVAGGPRGAA